MSLSSAAMRLLADKGLSLEDMIAVAAANEAERVAPDAAERKRIRDRERIALKRYNERLSRDKDDIECRSSGATKGDIGATSAPPRPRIDNNLPSENNNLTIPDFACASWPETDPPSKADLDRLQEALTEAGGLALASPAIAPKIAVLAPILRLARTGKGPPCDLQADVLPVIRARSARAPPGSIKSWDFFTEAICEARDRRLSGAPAQQSVPTHERPDTPPKPSAKFAARQANLERAFARSEDVADRRDFQRASG